jgi:transcriptional regulator with XRE-family HTH domain
MANHLGEKIRDTRKRLKLTLNDLSQRSGLSVSQLSKLENGKQRISVDLALKLAGVLLVPVTSFLSDPGPNPQGRRAITRSGTGLVHEAQGIRFEVLCNDFRQKSNLFWLVTVHAQSFEAAGGWRAHSGEEFIRVQSGRLKLHSQLYEPLVLEPGDSILFDGAMNHAYVALDGVPAVLLMSNSVSGGYPMPDEAATDV